VLVLLDRNAELASWDQELAAEEGLWDPFGEVPVLQAQVQVQDTDVSLGVVVVAAYNEVASAVRRMPNAG
jgi:hypothetical protein